MRNSLLFFTILCFSASSSFAQNVSHKDPMRFTSDSVNNNYIPIDIFDCFKQLDLFFSDSTKQFITDYPASTFSTDTHFSFGRSLRNRWNLWSGSRLSVYFIEHDYQHPDNMSAIILDLYQRHLRGEKIDEELELGERGDRFEGRDVLERN